MHVPIQHKMLPHPAAEHTLIDHLKNPLHYGAARSLMVNPCPNALHGAPRLLWLLKGILPPTNAYVLPED